MHEFKYKKHELYCEGVRLSDLAKKYNTPLYVYSKKTLEDHYQKIKEAFSAVKPLICYSVKASSNLSVCRTLVKKGAGLDIVSGGELYRALKAGASPKKIVYAGVGKTEKEIEYAVKTGILLFNAESLTELKTINKIASKLKKKQSVAIRVNPDVKAGTHKYITTGHKENKFGIDINTARDIFLKAGDFKFLDISGVHLHIGSQITDVKPFARAIKKVTDFIADLQKLNIRVKFLNIGGGLGIIYHDERARTAIEYAKAVIPVIKKIKAGIILEPGRFIAGNSGVFLTRVLYLKHSCGKDFAIVDGAMNDIMRPSLYEAYHEILPVKSRSYKAGRKPRKFDVVGPVCESGDFLGKERKFIALEEGDLLAVMSAGAYGFSMASNYNSRRKAAEVMVDGKRARMIRKRETYKDLVKNEIL